MPNMKPICLALVMVCALFSTAGAQESTTATATLTITANATGERVRVTAPSSVVQLHLEVYAAGGEKVFDEELPGANVFDWHLQDGQAQRLAPGTYVCVVTAKTISGKLTQKIGAVIVAENSASVRPGSPQQLSLPQTQAIGPVEADSSWTIAGGDGPQTSTVIANDGKEGQMIRGRGALTFRIGNFFSGVDSEQMRLTEAGDLGLGTSQPQSKLDVAGTIRAQRFLVVKPNLGAGDKTAAATQAGDGAEAVQPLVGGTGTTDRLTKWTDGPIGTLGDSGITETAGGNFGVGTTSPGTKLHISSSSPPRGIAQVIGTSGLTGSQIQLTQGGVDDWAFGQPAGVSAFAIWSGRAVGANGTERLRIDSSGNVGLGTTNPAGKLNVADGNIVLTDADVGHGMTDLMATNVFGKLSPLSSTDGGLDVWGFSDTGGGAVRVLGIMGSSDPPDSTPAITIRADKKSGTDSQVLGSLETVLQVQNRTTNLVTVLGSGNVGIGTTTPAERLTVQTAKGFYGFTHLATDANGANPIVLSTYVGGSASGATGGWFGTQTNHDLHFFTNGGQPSMTIIASGNVGIGTSIPTNKLHVESTGSGSVAVYGNVTNSGTGVWGNNTNNGTGVYGSSGNGIGILGESNGFAVRGKSNSGYAGYFEGKVYVGGPLEVFGNICAANFMCQSDARLKQAVTELHYGLSEVLRLRPVHWDWKDKAQRQLNLGLIAQEVEEVLPELVTTANDAEQTKGLIYIGLLPVVIKAIQEQQAALEQKETMLKSLKAENAALQQRNTELDARLTAVEQALQQLLNQQAQAQPGKRQQ